MRFEWDESKNRSNLTKHRLSFETALIDGVLVVLVAHTYGDQEAEEVIRIISARKATSFERRIYEDAREE